MVVPSRQHSAACRPAREKSPPLKLPPSTRTMAPPHHSRSEFLSMCALIGGRPPPAILPRSCKSGRARWNARASPVPLRHSVKTAAGAADFVSENLLFRHAHCGLTRKIPPIRENHSTSTPIAAPTRIPAMLVSRQTISQVCRPLPRPPSNCLHSSAGLQRVIPAPVPRPPRNFDLLPLVVSTARLTLTGSRERSSPWHRSTLRFASRFRTGQRKHKAFLTARIISSR